MNQPMTKLQREATGLRLVKRPAQRVSGTVSGLEGLRDGSTGQIVVVGRAETALLPRVWAVASFEEQATPKVLPEAKASCRAGVLTGSTRRRCCGGICGCRCSRGGCLR